jgi:predicted HD phosphohydrolase
MDVRVREEMERFFGEDRRRIAHALAVHAHAIRIQAAEGGDRQTVVMAALLHDVGIVPAEALHGSSAGNLLEAYGPPVAEVILRRLGADEERIAAVKEIIAHHRTPGVIRTKEFACLWDADLIVNLEGAVTGMDDRKIRGLIDEKFLTEEGKRIARMVFLGERW